ncbi:MULTISPECIES: Bug family tripartite tricarboxylate transporter substrate binding protein [Achromobacter]|uniref:Argininosuccinate lyase n=1 Tax=Achromobacter aegrifaciens TaxID=1287736 RepID=A0AAD2J0C7_ACHAE|nr:MULTISPECIES: tripartite tricarboxylate transporter substrate binding protein [Achromobacter]MBD9380020.1 tripartite tricarboxylate transporter substrate binding protein [Achromobacter sp. ACM02]MBD9428791.1 tripartite tricarboxylate transporter substrate binding protein [Achromobacter sp. ACM03]MDQ1760139.1 tripartite tricarboxylate transporter substrate binding protein [Achromobacter aegrifaciens]MDR7948480.1 tripartite tricarboxylate transporter substrate binding protein [Achromobacter ae
MRPYRLSALAFSALSAVSVLSAAHAADYPARSMELVVAYQPGGGSDNTARAIAEAVRPPMLAQPTVVINKPGASGSIGWAYVANAQPDGYRLVLMTPEMLVVPLMGIGKTTVGDFQPIARFTDDPSSVTVRADAPWKTVEEFLADAKKNPERVAVSNAGIGTVPHMAAAALGEQAGVKFVHVPYQGSAPAIMGLLAGDVQATTVAYAELQQHVETGKLRTLAVMAPKRLDNLPSVPTMKEKGADLQFSVWRGIGLPKATPADAVEKWRAAARQVAQSQDFQALMRKQNLTPSYADQPQFTADVARQEEAFKALVPKLNLKP